MKWFTIVSLSLIGSASAFTAPTMATRAVGRKTAAKSATRTISKKKVVAKAPVEKAATKKVVAKKPGFNFFAKKPVAETPAATKSVGKKSVGKKTFAKKVVAKKVVAKKVVAKKVVAKKVVAKKVVAKKVVAKKPIAKKPIAKKPVAKKPVAKKPFARKTVAKKPAAKKGVAKKAVANASSSGPPSSKGYPSFAEGASKIAFNVKISGSPPPRGYQQPDFADPRLQIKRDPAVWAAAAKTRQAPLAGNVDFAYDDGLTVIERRQKKDLPTFLSGSAKSQIDTTAIRGDITADNLLFGLDADRFQLLFITVFGLFTLIGCLSGTVTL